MTGPSSSGMSSAAPEPLVAAAEQAFNRYELGAAIDFADQAVALCRDGTSAGTLGWALMVLARSHGARGNSATAYAHALEAYELLGECGNIQRQLRALNVCAMVHFRAGDQREAIQLIERGIAIAQQHQIGDPCVTMLFNLSILLFDGGEHLEALRCCDEALAIVEKSAIRRDAIGGLRSHKAWIRVELAAKLSLSPQQHQADIDSLLAQAAFDLPPLPELPCPQSGDSTDWPIKQIFHSLKPLMVLKRWPEAKRATTLYVRHAVCHSGSLRARVNALTALSAWHECQGQSGRAIACMLSAFQRAGRISDNRTFVTHARRLEGLYAQSGDFHAALSVRRSVQRRHADTRATEHALRVRLSVIQRETARRLQLAREAQSHNERLAVIGRLIAQTYHALSAPVQSVSDLIGQARTRAAAVTDGNLEGLRRLLDAVVERIDAVYALVSQLKLYAYRSAPQASLVMVKSALHEAWSGMAPHVGSSASRPLLVDGNDEARIWCDVQRLGIMLKLLFIQLLQHAPLRDSGVAVRALVHADGRKQVQLRIAREPLQGETGAADHVLPVGALLCAEIVAEMNGRLVSTQDAAGVCRFDIELPQPDDTQRFALPRSLANLYER
jgi:tetratricopeptide (TPR) repeat protein